MNAPAGYCPNHWDPKLKNGPKHIFQETHREYWEGFGMEMPASWRILIAADRWDPTFMWKVQVTYKKCINDCGEFTSEIWHTNDGLGLMREPAVEPENNTDWIAPVFYMDINEKGEENNG